MQIGFHSNSLIKIDIMFENNKTFIIIIIFQMVIAASIIVFFSNTFDFVYVFEFKNQVSDLYTNEPFWLPFGENNYSITNDYSPYRVNPINIPAITNKATPIQSLNSIPCNNNNCGDNFNSKLYTLVEGQSSSNGLWYNVYAGYGTTCVEQVNK
ncbi:MAG TPA: hypothetical protein VN704_02160, partial [Verrucomicrobiae bacterium]|nr:hypothetical protein [Verrucomicrobiae bacterium]